MEDNQLTKIDPEIQNRALSIAINEFRENAIVKFNSSSAETCIQALYDLGSQRIVYLLQGIPFDLVKKKI